MKKIIGIVVAILVVVGIVVGIGFYQYSKEQEAIRLAEEARLQEEQRQQQEIEYAYIDQNNAFWMISDVSRDYSSREYIPYAGVDEPPLYVSLHVYQKETGNEVTLQDVAEYLSISTEEDGSLRLYNNGKHPTIQGYVEWERDHQYIVTNYRRTVIDTLVSYGAEHPDEPISKKIWSSLTLEEVIELVKKTDDPTYEMQFPDAGE